MTSNLTRYEAFQLCVIRAGGQDKLADAMGVTQPTVSNRLRLSKQMPPEWVLKAEELYGVSRHDLRPDIYPRAIDGRDNIVDQCSDLRFQGVDQQAQRSAA